MLRREGRLGNPEHETETLRHRPRREPPKLYHWEVPIFVVVFIALLIFGAIYGLNWMISLFPY
jgi:hypothetical protein